MMPRALLHSVVAISILCGQAEVLWGQAKGPIAPPPDGTLILPRGTTAQWDGGQWHFDGPGRFIPAETTSPPHGTRLPSDYSRFVPPTPSSWLVPPSVAQQNWSNNYTTSNMAESWTAIRSPALPEFKMPEFKMPEFHSALEDMPVLSPTLSFEPPPISQIETYRGKIESEGAAAALRYYLQQQEAAAAKAKAEWEAKVTAEKVAWEAKVAAERAAWEADQAAKAKAEWERQQARDEAARSAPIVTVLNANCDPSPAYTYADTSEQMKACRDSVTRANSQIVRAARECGIIVYPTSTACGRLDFAGVANECGKTFVEGFLCAERLAEYDPGHCTGLWESGKECFGEIGHVAKNIPNCLKDLGKDAARIPEGIGNCLAAGGQAISDINQAAIRCGPNGAPSQGPLLTLPRCANDAVVDKSAIMRLP